MKSRIARQHHCRVDITREYAWPFVMLSHDLCGGGLTTKRRKCDISPNTRFMGVQIYGNDRRPSTRRLTNTFYRYHKIFACGEISAVSVPGAGSPVRRSWRPPDDRTRLRGPVENGGPYYFYFWSHLCFTDEFTGRKSIRISSRCDKNHRVDIWSRQCSRYINLSATAKATNVVAWPCRVAIFNLPTDRFHRDHSYKTTMIDCNGPHAYTTILLWFL